MAKLPVILIGLALATSTAAAETKSWAQLKNKLPATTVVVGGVDMVALRGTTSFPKLVAWMKTATPEVGAVLDAFKPVCGAELPSMVADMSFAFGASYTYEKQGVIVFGLAGTNQAKATDCITKLVAKFSPTTTLSAKTTGKITEYSTGTADAVYASWLAPDVVAISGDRNRHAALDAMAQGAAATGDLATYLGKTNPAAPAWVAFAPHEDGVKGGFGMVALGKTLNLALKVTAMTAADGDTHRSKMTERVQGAVERAGSKPDLKRLLQAVKIGGKDAEVTLDVSAPEASIASALPALLEVM
jgi:hypothetical protein